MLNSMLYKPILLLLGIISSAMAQIILKLIASQDVFSLKWSAGIFLSILFYGISFILYSYILRIFPISTASPVMMIGVVIFVVLAGVLLGENLTFIKTIGLILGIASIILILA